MDIWIKVFALGSIWLAALGIVAYFVDAKTANNGAFQLAFGGLIIGALAMTFVGAIAAVITS